jgi:hypothetical protein
MAEAPRIEAGRTYAAGFFFSGGMNSALDPAFLSERHYAAGYNILNRGGVLSCRPGFDSLPFCFPYGPIQGGCLFTPTGAPTHLIFAVAGRVYASRAPFKDYFQITGIRFRKSAPVVYFCPTVQSAVRNSDGTLTATSPKNVLVMQDGMNTRAACWDGGKGRHLSPGKLETPLGGVMRWSGDRLWVSQKNKLVASDIANPLSFSENQYLSDGQSFLVDDDITALGEIPSSLGLGGSPQLICTTADSLSVFQSGIRERAAWKTTRDFQKKVFSSLGCPGHRAMIERYGQLWFFSANGLVALDSGLLSNSTSRIRYRDTEMAVSKAYINAPWLKFVALGGYDNFLLCSVPNGSARNRHTWVMDQSVADSLSSEAGPGWASIWTGLRPVEWISGIVDGAPRIFCLSRDYDNRGRIWEAFGPKPLDNGHPISWTVETRGHAGGNMISPAQLEQVDVHLLNLADGSKISVDYAGAYRGAWKEILTRTVRAKTDGIVPGTFTDTTEFFDLKNQSRTFRSTDLSTKLSAFKSPELAAAETLDYVHQIRVRGVGPGALRGYKLAFGKTIEPSAGPCSPAESEQAAIRTDGSTVRIPIEITTAPVVPHLWDSIPEQWDNIPRTFDNF